MEAKEIKFGPGGGQGSGSERRFRQASQETYLLEIVDNIANHTCYLQNTLHILQ